MACKEDDEPQPWTAAIARDGATQTRTDYCVDNMKDFTLFFATQSRIWVQGKNKAFPVIEAQLLSEIAKYHNVTETQLSDQLTIDTEGLTCVLDELHKRGLVSKTSITDSEQPIHYSLTELGKDRQKAVDSEFRNNVAKTLATLSTTKQTCLVDAANTIKTLLSVTKPANMLYSIRSHQTGDIGWIVSRHGVLYAQEYGWSAEVEALAAEITANFLRNYDPKLERCFIAERNGENVGSIFITKKSENVAQLRLLLVEPSARGLGIGYRLVEECVTFAQQSGYSKIVLWTHAILHSAVRIYKALGFQLVKEENHYSFGKEVLGQTWELVL